MTAVVAMVAEAMGAIKISGLCRPTFAGACPNAPEKAEVVANCDHLARLKFSPQLPMAFTEHGAIMAAMVTPVLGAPVS